MDADMVNRCCLMPILVFYSLVMRTSTKSNANPLARQLLVVLSMLFITVAVAQRPLDRGIHKRTTGGVSFLFGHKKRASKAVAFEECLALQPQSPVAVQLEDAPNAVLQKSFVALPVVAAPNARRWHRVVRPLKKRNCPLVARRNSEKPLLRHLADVGSNRAEGNAPFDWASVVAFWTPLMTFLWFSSVAPHVYGGVYFASSLLVGLVLGAIGLKRTKSGQKRGRRYAIAAFILSLATLTSLGIGALLWL